ncbi:4-hydroxy-3-methylbut-2-enyl diphosphate reductase [Actinophytocola oryzae]|uniref:4-hydroxy-3-methylbut-2-enyl diphosphate reductase n=1 Tax=Actinophytocola oryzae TaxID=502181 RepID=A0A4R7W0L0_9PSEU|nr:4-hydroxy-3-methylbut-2-enyl diphosphate reductase [Actinophytocola oryzae]
MPRGFEHPDRGWVHCPANCLLAAHLRGVGLRVRTVDAVISPGRGEPGEALLLAMSYVDIDGFAVGLGAAAQAVDHVGIAAIEDAVGIWSGVVRTRRALLASPLSVAAAKGTALAAERAREFADRGDTVLVVGQAGRAASEVLARAPHATALITSTTRARTATAPAPEKVSFVVAPGIAIEDAVDIVAVLRARFPSLRGQYPGEFCYEASDQREAVRSVTAASDLVLICDPDGDSATQEMVRSIGSGAPGVRRLTQTGQICAQWLTDVATVGLVSTSPGGERLAWEVVAALSGLGPLAVATRAVSTAHLAVGGRTVADSQVLAGSLSGR